MSRLSDLIAEFCPNGVEFKRLGEVISISKGVQFNKSDMRSEGSFPVINGGINPSGYIEKYNQAEDTITISQGGASAGYVNWLSTKFWAGAHCYVVKPLDNVINRYVFHFLKSKEKNLQECQYGAGIPALSKATVESLLIPVPPLEIQREIVRILDVFTELTAELVARKQQYEYYRDLLLTFGDDKQVEFKTLGEIANLKTGTKPKNIISQAINNYYPYVNAGTTPSGYVKESNRNGGVITTPSRGQGGIGFVGYQDNPFWLGSLCYGITVKNPNFIVNKYLYYCLCSSSNAILKLKNEGGTPALNSLELGTIKIPVPPLEEQERIVKILDRFDKLCNDLSEGLPAEIEARQKQYEYYRDKLLSFDKDWR